MPPLGEKCKMSAPERADNFQQDTGKLAAQLLPLANYFGKRFFQVILGRDAGPADDESQFLVAMETLYFSAYLAGRIEASNRGADQRASFLDALRMEIYRLLFNAQPGADKVQFGDYTAALEKGWQRAREAFDRCPLPLPKNESDLIEGTLFWEFCKRLITAAQAPTADSITTLMQAAIELGDAVPNLVAGADWVSASGN
jgi:hypothetical protein